MVMPNEFALLAGLNQRTQILERPSMQGIVANDFERLKSVFPASNNRLRWRLCVVCFRWYVSFGICARFRCVSTDRLDVSSARCSPFELEDEFPNRCASHVVFAIDLMIPGP